MKAGNVRVWKLRLCKVGVCIYMICTMYVCQASADLNIGCSLQAELSKELEKWSFRNDDLKRQIVSSPDKLRAVSTVCSAIYSHIRISCTSHGKPEC